MKAQKATRKNPTRTDIASIVPLRTPFVLFVDPSSACNFRCTFCPTGDRELIRSIGRHQGAISLSEFKKILDDVGHFPDKVKVLRLYKDGEPLMNRNLAAMIRLAKESGHFEAIDTTTNGALLTPEKSDEILAAGIDLINISVDGLDAEQFLSFAQAVVNFDEYLENLRYLYEHRGNCTIVIKTTREIIGNDREQEFFDTFGNLCDRISVENTSPCWPDFDVEERMGINIKSGLYGNEIVEQTACPYLFYSISVNSDMKVSACFVDWSRELIVGDLREESLADVWTGDRMNGHRAAHLDGRRSEHPVCGDCGQISHCGPDSIEGSLIQIRSRFEQEGLFDSLDAILPLIGYPASPDAKFLQTID